MGSFALGLTAAALALGMVLSLLENSAMKGLVKLTGGIFLAAALLRPLDSMELPELGELGAQFRLQGASIAAMGQEFANEETAGIIKAAAEAYILDKAAVLGADIQVSVSLDDANIPAGAVMEGQVSPYVRRRLEQILTQELGIPREEQQWIG